MDQYITSLEDYKRAVRYVFELFNLIPDNRCIDATHLYYASTSIYSKNINGGLVNMVEAEDFGVPTIPNIITSSTNEKKFQYILSEVRLTNKLKGWVNKINSKTIKGKREFFLRILIAQANLVTTDKKTEE